MDSRIHGHAGQVGEVIVEARGIQFREVLALDHLHADRDVLEVFLALLRGDDDLLERCALRGLHAQAERASHDDRPDRLHAMRVQDTGDDRRYKVAGTGSDGRTVCVKLVHDAPCFRRMQRS
jgi:hypothetical protein